MSATSQSSAETKKVSASRFGTFSCEGELYAVKSQADAASIFRGDVLQFDHGPDGLRVRRIGATRPVNWIAVQRLS